ncbi:MAG: hypothetical protein Q9167_002811 [Letrouitia subvulpina]
MRLIKYEGRNLNLVEYGDTNIPRYAILSHTWGADGEEVTFKDLMEGVYIDKAGCEKIEFCRKEAARDGLEYFWVDTRCIDKSSSAELTEAINSMFRWYENADKCYVYLSDVSVRISGHGISVPPSPTEWGTAFKKSRWFCRGWTLQELIAPESVHFYSREGCYLGSKKQLEQYIHNVTGIPIKALRKDSLKAFSVEERLSWAKHRETKRQEDIAYSLLGIFDIYMPLLYGEGRERALMRLRKEIDMSDYQLSESELRSSNSRNLTSINPVRVWKPRYYFFYGKLTNASVIGRSLGLANPPVVYPAFVRGYSVATLGQWKALLNGPADSVANGVAYKIENEWQESKLIREESEQWVPGPCIISILTGDGLLETEGRAFKYCGPKANLKNILPGASPFKDVAAANAR